MQVLLLKNLLAGRGMGKEPCGLNGSNRLSRPAAYYFSWAWGFEKRMIA